jgi:diguanylate cyclase (GGDEF)-like protein/PAS domain S-box-containing protein
MRTDAALRRSEEQYRLIVELAQEGIWVVDGTGSTTYANRALAALLGMTVPELLGRSIYEFVAEEPGTDARLIFERPLTASAAQHDLQLRTDDGRTVWTRVNVRPIVLRDGTYGGAIALVTDVTERRRLEEQLEREARVDALTGIANRKTLFEILSRELLRRERCAVLFADLDNFKLVNDTYGHGAGDETLRIVAARLAHNIRRHDTVARVGGDEFVVVSTSLNNEQEAVAIGSRIRAAISQPVFVDDEAIPIDVSVGLAFAAPDDDADSLVARADQALYRAKRNGRGRLEIAGGLTAL